MAERNIGRIPNAFPGTMTKKLLFVFTILLAVTLVAMAADVTGKWTYEQQMMGRGGDGAAPQTTTMTLDLKADGSKLTGTLSGGMGRGGQPPAPSEIADGKVDGNKISFSISRPGRGGGDPIVTTYKGTLNGDTLELEFTRPGRGGDPQTTKVTAKRSTT